MNKRPKMEFLPDDAYAVHLSSAAHTANAFLDWDTIGSGETPDDPMGPEEDVNDPHQRQSMFIERKFSRERAMQPNNQLPLDLHLPIFIAVTSDGAKWGSRPFIRVIYIYWLGVVFEVTNMIPKATHSENV